MSPTIYSPVPDILTSPERLVELNTLMCRVTSGCRVIIPASARPIIAVHGSYFSFRMRKNRPSYAPNGSAQSVQIVVSEQDRMLSREWFNQVWIPLHLAAIEGDTEGLFSAEVNLVKRELSCAQGAEMTDCQCWASLASLSFRSLQVGMDKNDREDLGTYAFRAARVVSHYFSQKAAESKMPGLNPEWERILFSSKQNCFPDGWLESFIRRAERVFICAKRQCGMLSDIPATVLSVQKHRCASRQSHDRIQDGSARTAMLPDVPDGEERGVHEIPLCRDSILPSYPVQSTDLAEEE